ncbi:hypothetical protein [Paenibacillus sp. Pae108]|uniref:hypothetical protein n=1 Tax=Paenibacillus sp. Pae108 TaxID=2926019 RepID=UPI002119443D|nr:hypothetical protein [Paenibacillus sp. Pae108]
MKKLKVPKISEETIRETCLVAGFFMLEIGLWMIYTPAAFLIGGVILMWLGLPPRRGN